MAKYNTAFFRLYESLFLLLQDEFGTKKALRLFSRLMERTLAKAYDAEGFKKGNAADFARVVGKRDAGLGLKVKFPVVGRDRIVYQFWTDPFPGLKGKVAAGDLDRTYMGVKVSHLLGKGWGYATTRHLWKGDRCTEHIIEKT